MKNILQEMLCDIDAIISRISSGKLSDYDFTQIRLKETDVSTDLEYRRKYNSFYVMRQRPAEWYQLYFGLLERSKSDSSVTFESVLATFFGRTNRVEPSFSSKLVATIRPDSPVYDEVVRRNLRIPKPLSKSAGKRLLEALSAYKQIEQFYTVALSSDEFMTLRREFDRSFPDFTHFTGTKKLDILLWQWRPKPAY